MIIGNDVGALIESSLSSAEHHVSLLGTYVTHNRVGLEACRNNPEIFRIERCNICGNVEYNFKTTVEGTSTANKVWWGTTNEDAVLSTILDTRSIFASGLLQLDLAAGPIPDLEVDGRCTRPGLNGTYTVSSTVSSPPTLSTTASPTTIHPLCEPSKRIH